MESYKNKIEMCSSLVFINIKDPTSSTWPHRYPVLKEVFFILFCGNNSWGFIVSNWK